jgi:hypothetical protein
MDYIRNTPMRLWTLHPRYLDSQGLVAAWREALLAQKVLAGLTKGYQHHPQLLRFKAHNKPVETLAAFLTGLLDDAIARGYQFDPDKISKPRFRGQIETTQGQLDYEWEHLLGKLKRRDPGRYRDCVTIVTPDAHPLFRIIPGEVEPWERIN